jgi:tRNA(adenine34) deaminase
MDKASTEAPTMSTKKYWIHKVKTVSTSPPEGIFTKDAKTIARVMASKKVSPRGIASGIRMVQYYINRAGKGISAARKRELEKAKKLLHERLERAKGRSRPKNESSKARRKAI